MFFGDGQEVVENKISFFYCFLNFVSYIVIYLGSGGVSFILSREEYCIFVVVVLGF